MATPGSLARSVGFWGAVWLGLGSILGTGVFVSLGIAAGVAGPSVVLAVALAALVATANGLSSAQLAAAHPVSGGTYEYAHRLVHPRAGFAAGWMFLSAKSASAATAALGFAGYLLHVLGVEASTFARVGVALALVVALTALVAGGMRRSNAVNAIIVTLTLLTLGAFAVVAFVEAAPGAAQRRLTEDVFGAAPDALLQATALMFVAYTGYGRIATLGEEVTEPARTIPRAVITTLALTMVLYVAVAAAGVTAVGADAFAEATASLAAPLEVVARTFDAAWVAPVVAIGAVTAMAGVLLNLLLGLSRVLLAMARRAEMPTGFAALDDGGSPRRAVIGIGVLIAGLTLLGDVRTTWTFSAFTVLIYYGLTNLSALRLAPEHRRFPRAIAVFGLVACFGLAFFVPAVVWGAGLGLLVIGFGLRAGLHKIGKAPSDR
ncbi:MAG: amino acid permease [Myxococcales bacterium]|nr:amino acid permease [Myxococcales bacterium]MCB9538057.1 amino acid permease [Myxococcales bacterium]